MKSTLLTAGYIENDIFVSVSTHETRDAAIVATVLLCRAGKTGRYRQARSEKLIYPTRAQFAAVAR